MKLIDKNNRREAYQIETSDIGKTLKYLGTITEKDVGKRLYSPIVEIDNVEMFPASKNFEVK